jgi:hypothetical protein
LNGAFQKSVVPIITYVLDFCANSLKSQQQAAPGDIGKRIDDQVSPQGGEKPQLARLSRHRPAVIANDLRYQSPVAWRS